MVTLVLLVVAGVAVAAVVAGLVRAGRREARAEQARRQEEERRRARRLLTAVWKMNGAQFEEYVAGLCRRDGCTEVQRVGGAGDLGADVIGFLPDGRKLVIQCKRYAKHRSVGSRDLQTFNGTARDEHGADAPVFVASCVFTQQARAFAAKHHLVLIDVNLLGFWNSGTPLTAFLDLDIGRSGNHRKIAPDD
ncbi:restriction endonuclease [Streptomyces sp. NPDC059788]|uniref:restriction endonuclease n=1 Tax=Streptomyces sp. NPDC059788 TaxID=3346948 RepID=UPI0036581587